MRFYIILVMPSL